MINIRYFTFGDFQENTYLLFDETRECVIIDPGCYKSSEQSQLVAFIEENGLKLVKLLNTHCHIDHVLGNSFVLDKFKVPFYMHEGELFTYKDTLRWTTMLGISPLEIPENPLFVTEKDIIAFGNSELKIAFTPGHSIASITFYHPEQGFAIAGDVLFRESIGRTDLPGGNFETLAQSIRGVFYAWPDDTKIYPGHGEPTTVGHERKFNPFVKG
jgi:hydroxyacylglutathione hydrolase